MKNDETILEEILLELTRQQQLKKEGRFKYTLADPEMNDFERLAAITEETGEVATCLLEESTVCAPGDKQHDKRAEIVQVAACCWAWLRHLNSVE